MAPISPQMAQAAAEAQPRSETWRGARLVEVLLMFTAACG